MFNKSNNSTLNPEGLNIECPFLKVFYIFFLEWGKIEEKPLLNFKRHLNQQLKISTKNWKLNINTRRETIKLLSALIFIIVLQQVLYFGAKVDITELQLLLSV